MRKRERIEFQKKLEPTFFRLFLIDAAAAAHCICFVQVWRRLQ